MKVEMSEEEKETKDKSEFLSLDTGNHYISMNKNRDIGKHSGVKISPAQVMLHFNGQRDIQMAMSTAIMKLEIKMWSQGWSYLLEFVLFFLFVFFKKSQEEAEGEAKRIVGKEMGCGRKKKEESWEKTEEEIGKRQKGDKIWLKNISLTQGFIIDQLDR